MRRLVALFLALWSAHGVAQAAETPPAPESLEALEQRIAAIVADGGVPAASVALVSRDGVVWARAFGVADKASGRAATPDTPFRAGSISKTVTALTAMRLVEEGRLDLETPLAVAVPEAAFRNPWEAEHPVRLVHLLEHTAGFDDVNQSEYRDRGEEIPLAEALAVDPYSRVSRWPPGQYFSYANSGAALVAAAIAAAAGRPFEEVVTERLFVPLGIRAASWLNEPALQERLARSYYEDGSEAPYTHIGLRPAGSLNISSLELARVVQLFLARGEVDGVRLLSPESIARMERSETTRAAAQGMNRGAGLGLGHFAFAGVPFIGHTGSIDAALAFFGYRPDADQGFVVMMTAMEGRRFREIGEAVAGYFASQVPAVPEPRVAEDLSVYPGYYRLATPGSDLFRLVTDVAGVIVVETDGADGLRRRALLGGEPKPLVPVGERRFRDGDEAQASAIFLTEDGRIDGLQRGLAGYFERVGPLSVWWRPVLLALALAALLATALIGLPALLLRPLGGAWARRALATWSWTIAAAVTLVCATVLLLAAMAAPGHIGPERLGRPSATSVAILLGTLLFPVFAALGVRQAWRRRDGAVLRRVALACALLLLALGLLFADYKLIGLTTWAYRSDAWIGLF